MNLSLHNLRLNRCEFLIYCHFSWLFNVSISIVSATLQSDRWINQMRQLGFVGTFLNDHTNSNQNFSPIVPLHFFPLRERKQYFYGCCFLLVFFSVYLYIDEIMRITQSMVGNNNAFICDVIEWNDVESITRLAADRNKTIHKPNKNGFW